MVHTSETGYVATDTLSGIDIQDENGSFICELQGLSLSRFEDENGNIDDDQLEQEIRDTLDAQEFLDYQGAYC
jgi:hypothetical protein